MKKPVLFALAVALAPLSAQAGGGVSISVSTPEFGFRIGAPFFHGAPVFVPAPVVVAAPVYAPAPVFMPPPPVFVPAPVFVPPPRVIVPAPVVLPPRVVYRAPVLVVPRYAAPRHRTAPPYTVYPRGRGYDYDDHGEQQARYRVPPGQARHGMLVAKGKARYD
jgi:hypothetical protein